MSSASDSLSSPPGKKPHRALESAESGTEEKSRNPLKLVGGSDGPVDPGQDLRRGRRQKTGRNDETGEGGRADPAQRDPERPAGPDDRPRQAVVLLDGPHARPVAPRQMAEGLSVPDVMGDAVDGRLDPLELDQLGIDPAAELLGDAIVEPDVIMGPVARDVNDDGLGGALADLEDLVEPVLVLADLESIPYRSRWIPASRRIVSMSVKASRERTRAQLRGRSRLAAEPEMNPFCAPFL